MEVYVDLVVILNFLVDFLLLLGKDSSFFTQLLKYRIVQLFIPPFTFAEKIIISILL